MSKTKASTDSAGLAANAAAKGLPGAIGSQLIFEFNADRSNVGTGASPGDPLYVAISECPGDFRAAVPGSPDPNLNPACRVNPSEGPFMYANFGPPQAGMCNMDPAKTYYFNVIWDHPSDGFDPNVPCNVPLNKIVCAFRMAVLPR